MGTTRGSSRAPSAASTSPLRCSGLSVASSIRESATPDAGNEPSALKAIDAFWGVAFRAMLSNRRWSTTSPSAATAYIAAQASCGEQVFATR
jgi:hypothetical protein